MSRFAYRKFGITDEEYTNKLASGFRWCAFGKHWMPKEESPRPDGGYCKKCTLAYQRRYNGDERHLAKRRDEYQRNKEKHVAVHRAYYASLSLEKRQQMARQAKLRGYGVTPEWYDRQLARQEGVCAICKNHLPSGKFKKYMHVDHDHETGKARGILCNGCNTGIGWLDKKDWIQKAMQYLASFDERTTPSRA